MSGKKSDSVAVPPLVWSSLNEHVFKIILYSSCLAWVVVRSSETTAQTSLLGLVLQLFTGILLLWMIYNELDYFFLRLTRKLPPGVFGMPIIREIYGIYQLATSGFSSLIELRRKHGSMFATILFGRVNITLGGQDDLQWQFMNDRKALTEISWPPNIKMLLGPGAVANQSGKYHRVLRRLLEPYFLPRFVTNYLKAMDETTMDDLERWCNTNSFVSSEEFKMYALRLFYVSSFGSVDEDKIEELHKEFTTWLNGFMSPITANFPGNPFTEAMKARDRILEIVEDLIENFEKQNPEDSERAQTTVIGRLVYGKDEDNNRMMTREEIKDNVLNIIFAGHDTTYASISTLLHHLSQNPKAMEALAEEVSHLAEPLDANELKNAPVLNACIHEAWRMDPPVAGSFRKAVKNLPEYKGYSFQKDTVFNYSIAMVTQDENVYAEPSKFHFERFLPPDHPLHKPDFASGIDPLQGRSSYPIFGGGTHVCLGKAFAQLELRVLATRMMQHYTVQVRNSQKVPFPVNGWSVEFKLTKKKSA